MDSETTQELQLGWPISACRRFRRPEKQQPRTLLDLNDQSTRPNLACEAVGRNLHSGGTGAHRPSDPGGISAKCPRHCRQVSTAVKKQWYYMGASVVGCRRRPTLFSDALRRPMCLRMQARFRRRLLHIQAVAEEPALLQPLQGLCSPRLSQVSCLRDHSDSTWPRDVPSYALHRESKVRSP